MATLQKKASTVEITFISWLVSTQPRVMFTANASQWEWLKHWNKLQFRVLERNNNMFNWTTSPNKCLPSMCFFDFQPVQKFSSQILQCSPFEASSLSNVSFSSFSMRSLLSRGSMTDSLEHWFVKFNSFRTVVHKMWTGPAPLWRLPSSQFFQRF